MFGRSKKTPDKPTITPGKLSLKYRKFKQNQSSFPSPGTTVEAKSIKTIVISDSEEEQEEKENVPRFRSNFSVRSNRRDSTILAGNLTILDSDDDDSPICAQGQKVHPDYMQVITEDEEEEANNFLTADETNYLTNDEDDVENVQHFPSQHSLKSKASSRSGEVSSRPDRSDSLVLHLTESSTASNSCQEPATPTGHPRTALSPLPGPHRTALCPLPGPNRTRTPQPGTPPPNNRIASSVKASRIFSAAKRFDREARARVLAGGSDQESDSDDCGQLQSGLLRRPVLSRVLAAAAGEKTIILNSDEELPSPGRNLSESKLERVTAWLSSGDEGGGQQIGKPSAVSNIDSLLDSNSSHDASLPIQESRGTSKALGSWNKRLDYSPNITAKSDRGAHVEQSTSKPGTVLDKQKRTNANSSQDRAPIDTAGCSEGTSKAGGGRSFSSSQGTSKAGDSWRRDSQGTTGKGSWNGSVFTGSQGTSITGSQGTSKAGGSWNASLCDSSQGTSKAGGSWNRRSCQADNTHTGSSQDSSLFSGGSQDTSNPGGRGSSSSSRGGTSNPVDRGSSSRGDTSRIHVNKSRNSSTVRPTWSTVSGENTGHQPNTSNRRLEPDGTSGLVPLVYLNKSSLSDSQQQPAFVYGDESLRNNFAHPIPPDPMTLPSGRGAGGGGGGVSKSGRKKPATTSGALSNSLASLTIDNSVNAAVRSWEEVEKRTIPAGSVTSIRREKQAVQTPPRQPGGRSRSRSSCEEGEDSFNKFLTSIKKSRGGGGGTKSPGIGVQNRRRRGDSDEDFIVPDDAVEENCDSSWAVSPDLNLRERILLKKKAREGMEGSTKGTPVSTAKKNGPNKDMPAKPTRKPALCSSSSEEDEQLPSPNSPVTARTRTHRGGQRRANVIISDSDDESAPSHQEDSSRADSPIYIPSDEEADDSSSSRSDDAPRNSVVFDKGTVVDDAKKKKSSTTRKNPPNHPAKPLGRAGRAGGPVGSVGSVGPGGEKKGGRQKPAKKQLKAEAEVVAAPPGGDLPTLTFLSSLTIGTPVGRCHPGALRYLTEFKKRREELAIRLYQLYNREIFEECLPADMAITWNVRLTKTAGLCYSKRYKNKFNVETRSSRIELSTKVLDSGDRLRDTLIHEMCHAASWIISGYRDGHGPLWRTWAVKAMNRFPELPVIDRCHSYQIRTKYSYVCEKCGYTIGRHSKSLDTERKVCGHCHGRFQLVTNNAVGVPVKTPSATKPGGAATAASQSKPPNPFALFVKENYKHHKKAGVTHKEVMLLLSQQFSQVKLKK